MLAYTVQKGDSLWQIARRYEITLDSLLAANPQITDPNYIAVGQMINIPELWQPPKPPEPEMPMENDICGADGRPCIYLAHEGDTLQMLSHAFSVPLTRLLYYNLRYEKNEPLPEGARIIVPEMEIFPVMPRCQKTGNINRRK